MKTINELLTEYVPKLQVERLSSTSSKLLMLLLMTEPKDSDKIDLMFEDMSKKAWSLKVLRERGKATFPIPVSKGVLIMITAVAKANVGMGLLYLNIIQWIAKNKNIDNVDIQNLCTDFFPRGFYTEESMQELWEAQKNERGNAIDSLELVNSIL